MTTVLFRRIVRPMTADGPVIHVRISKRTHDAILRRQRELAQEKKVRVTIPAIVRGMLEEATENGKGKR